MGRKAKLKKQPKQAKKWQNTEFVQEMQRQGYNQQNIERSPEVPNHQPHPEV